MVSATPPADVVIIDDIGPIQHLEIPCRPGTVVVLKSGNGTGKTNALNAIDALTSKNGHRLENRDGTHQGRIQLGEAMIKVGRRGANRRLGDPPVITLEDDLNLDDLVDPGLKDAGAADLRRTKALAKVCGLQLPIERLRELVGGPEALRAIVDESKLEFDDVVGSTDKVKRAIEGAARLAEGQATQHFQSAKAKLDENAGLDLTAESDEKVLQQALEQALSDLTAANTRQNSWSNHRRQQVEARGKLESAVGSYAGPTVELAEQTVRAASEALEAQEEFVRSFERQLQEARSLRQQLADRTAAAQNSLESARDHEQLIAGWRSTIEAGLSEPEPTDVELAEINQRLEATRQAQQHGVLIRTGLKRRDEAVELESKAAEARAKAERLRDAAAATLDVLAQAVSKISDRLTVDSDFRLVIEHPKRGRTYFTDLSAGERWKVALDIAVEAFKRKSQPGVLVIRQEAWEGLDGRNRKQIIDHVAGTDLTIYTAEASKDVDPAGTVECEVLGSNA